MKRSLEDKESEFEMKTKKSKTIDWNQAIRDLLDFKIVEIRRGCTQLKSSHQHLHVCMVLRNLGLEFISRDRFRENHTEGVDFPCFTENPNGTQRSPDFHIFTDERSPPIELECKSGKGTILWNDGFPEDNRLYFISDSRLKKNVIVPGKYLYNPDEKRSYTKIRKLLREKRQKTSSFLFYPRLATRSPVRWDLIPTRIVEEISRYFT